MRIPGPTADSVRRSVRSRRGTALVDAAAGLVVALMIFMGMMEVARLFMTQDMIEYAVRVGCRYAIANTDEATTTQVKDYVDNSLPKAGKALQGYSKTSSIKVFLADDNGNKVGTGEDTWQNAGFGQMICVELTGNYKPMSPLAFRMSTIPLTARSIMYSEAN